VTGAEPLPLRRNRDFLLLQAGQLLSTFGSSMSSIAYPLLALALTGSAAKTGYVGAVEFAPLVLLSPAAGIAADRFDRRWLMIASDAVGAIAVASLAATVLAGHARFWLILVVAFADSTAAVVFRAGSSGAFKAAVPQPQLADASSLAMARMSIVRLAAPPAGGALFGLSRGLPFLADAISYAFSTLSLLLMRTRFQEERAPGGRTRFREGLAYFWRIPFLRTTIGMVAASNLAAAGAPIALIVLAHRHGFSSAAIGGLVALQGVALLAGSTLSPLLRRLFPMRAILLSEFWMALVFGAFLAFPDVYVLAVAAALHAFWFPNTDSALNAYSYALIPDRLLGRAMAASNTLRAASAPVGPLLAGLLLAHTSPRLTIVVLAAPVVVAAVAGTLSAAIRDLPSLERPLAAGEASP
jgi:Transmembrane secretion effector